MLFAETDWASGAAAVASIMTFLAFAVRMWFDRDKDIRDKAALAVEKAEAKAEAAAEKAAAAVEYEKNKALALAEVAENKAQIAAVADKLEVVHKQSNSMKDELVAEVRKASFLAGKESAKEDGAAAVESETDKG